MASARFLWPKAFVITPANIVISFGLIDSARVEEVRQANMYIVYSMPGSRSSPVQYDILNDGFVRESVLTTQTPRYLIYNAIFCEIII